MAQAASEHHEAVGRESKKLAAFLLVEDPEPRRGLAHLYINPTRAAHISRVALPVVLGMLTQTAINILDTVMVGRLSPDVANTAQAAIGWSLPWMWMVGGFLSAVWVGTQAITSRRAGEGNASLAGRALTNSLVVAALSSLVFVTSVYVAAPRIIAAMYTTFAETVAVATEYLQLRLIGVPAMVLTFSYKSFFDGTGRTKIFMGTAVVMNLLNVVLNFIFIYGFEPLGIPSMAARGAALASVLAAYIGLVILVVWSLRPSLARQYHYYDVRRINLGVIREIIRLSVPNGLATVVVMLGFIAFYWVVGQVPVEPGYAGTADEYKNLVNTANQVVVTTAMVSFMTSLSFGMATAAIVSQALGAKRLNLAKRYGWEAAKLWSYVMWATGIVFLIAPEPVLALVNPDPKVIALALAPTRLLAFLQGLVAVAMILAQTLYGVGIAKFVMYVELFLHLFILSPCAYLFGVVFEGGLLGIYMGPTLYAGLLCAAMAWKFARDDWMHVRI